MTLRWSKVAIDTSFTGPVTMTDRSGAVVDMKLNDSLVVSDTHVTETTIIAQHPRLPTVDVKEPVPDKPTEFVLFQNYPNPFNPRTVIGYSLSVNSLVSLNMYDVLGREVASLVNRKQQPGRYTVSWDAKDVPSGVYFCRLEAVNLADPGKRLTQVRKMVLLK